MINWKVRIRNKAFWVSVIPMLFLFVQLVFALFGIDLDLSEKQEITLKIVDVVFAILAAMGIVTDHTTSGFSDSSKALTYDTPRNDEAVDVVDEER